MKPRSGGSAAAQDSTTHQRSTLSAALCGVLCAALSACGGGHQAATGPGTTSTELAAPRTKAGTLPAHQAPVPAANPVIQELSAGSPPPPPLAAALASAYTGVYWGVSAGGAGGADRIILWVHPDGRVGGQVEVQPEHVVMVLPFASNSPPETPRATVEVKDTAGQPWGRVELHGKLEHGQRTISATITPANDGARQTMVLEPLTFDNHWVEAGALTPIMFDLVVSTDKPRQSDRLAGTLHVSRDASTGDIAINGTFTYPDEGDRAGSIKLHANLRPTDVDGLYSARTDITIDNGQPFTLDGHAITVPAESDETPAILSLTGLAEGRSFRLIAGAGNFH
jgi:hypothetical protein